MDTPHRYTGVLAGQIEPRWRAYWDDHHTFYAEPDENKSKFYVLDQFPGPSGALHVGHPVGYIATDVYARYLRMHGKNVLHALGFDAFGLPAEQYAVQTGQHPRITTERNIETIRGQLHRLGTAYDPRRGVATTDKAYYRWTQWIFLQLFDSWYDDDQQKARPITELQAEFAMDRRRTPTGRGWCELTRAEQRAAVDAHRLAYVSEEVVNWCPGLGTVLANEEVTDEGRSERGNFPVFQRKLRQWVLRITAYKDRLLKDLDELDWPDSLKSQQRQWIPNMHDWLFSRQRYWGEPFPIVYDEHGPIALPEHLLPLELPETDDFTPTTYDPDDADSEPQAPLSRLTDWTTVTLDLGDGPREYRRETNTMPQWAGSCWYELRYLDPDNDEKLVDPALEKYWMGGDPGGVDLYVGGGEHAVLHLLYARFWHKVLYDLGHVSSREPFRTFRVIGYIQAYSYTDERGVYVPADEVVERDGGYWYGDKPVTRSLGKMGKSLRNMVRPDDIVDEYGADTFRVYVMSTGPIDAARPWDSRAISGAYRFLQRVWRLVVDEQTGAVIVTDDDPDDATNRQLHKAIDAVRRDLDELGVNTAIARLTELTTYLTGLERKPRAAVEALVLMLAPFAPYLAEELWSRLGHAESVAYHPYPQADPGFLAADSVVCVVQIDGKVRDRLNVPPTIDAEALEALARASEKVATAVGDRVVRRIVVKPPTLVNLVLA
jgi:leucyl-tRNA synthetase